MNGESSNFRFPTSDLRTATSDSQSRLRWLFVGVAILSFTVYSRLIALELRDGPEYRAIAAEPIVHKHTVAGMRGRILAADGTVLAYDQPMVCLAVQYRWLQEPVDPRWLRQMARSRLSAADRRDPRRMEAVRQQVLDQRRNLEHQLAALCGLTNDQWDIRVQRIQHRVELISAAANARQEARIDAKRQMSGDDMDSSATDWPALVGHSVVDALFSWDEPSPAPLTVAEELSEHVVFEGLSLDAVAEIESHPSQYPGVKLTHDYQRIYPQGDLAANVVGYLGRVTAEELAINCSGDAHLADDWVGRAGIERQYEALLSAHHGTIVDELGEHGKSVTSTTVHEPVAGRDVTISLDLALERTAQTLLQQAVARRVSGGDEKLEQASGGAIVVLNIDNGAILAAATAPRFNPNGFIQGDSRSIEQWLNDPAHPLLDRTVQMALPPGSIFKIISAAAVLDAGADPQAPVDCQGYLHQPDALRCAVFRRFGIGHGPVTLADALARSCNVYFFHHAEQFGAGPLMDWARRFELGRATGIDLPGEVGGVLPAQSTVALRSSPITLVSNQAIADGNDPRLLSIGQGPMTATPLQIARAVAAIANGGYLVTPHLAIREAPALRPIPGLNTEMVESIRKGLRRAVTDPEGTAHATVELNDVAIAGKTGTAETGGNQPEHAWFAGYAPADHPRVAFVVVLEHAGNADTAAGPVARRLVERMNELGYFAPRAATLPAENRRDSR